MTVFVNFFALGNPVIFDNAVFEILIENSLHSRKNRQFCPQTEDIVRAQV